MEDKDWFWQDDSYKLDAESPLAISRSLWAGLAQSEADSRTLFASTPTADIVDSDRQMTNSDKGDKSACADVTSLEGSPRAKRRRMLLFPGSTSDSKPEEPFGTALDSSYGNDCGSVIPSCEEYEKYGGPVPFSPNSLWYLKNDDPQFSLDEVFNSHAHKWMGKSFDDTRVHTASDPAELVVPLPQLSGSCSEYQLQECESEAINYSSTPFASPSISGRRSNLPQGRPKLVTPVAYPFALLKPCGAQGDVTLNDINQRISMPPSRPSPQLGPDDSPRTSSKQLSPAGSPVGSPGLSGKSVVALTKIHTEGNGTITIMRTRG